MSWGIQHTRSQHYNSIDPFWSDLINPSPHSIIIGDFNGNSHLWNYIQPPNAQGDKITDHPTLKVTRSQTTQRSRWQDHRLNHQQGPVVLNDRPPIRTSPIRTSRITGHDSTLNLSICVCNWSTKKSWTLAEPIRLCANSHCHQPRNQIPTSHSKEGHVWPQWH